MRSRLIQPPSGRCEHPGHHGRVSLKGMVQDLTIRRPRRIELLVAVLYLVAIAVLTGVALISPASNAYLVRFLVLFPSPLSSFFWTTGSG